MCGAIDWERCYRKVTRWVCMWSVFFKVQQARSMHKDNRTTYRRFCKTVWNRKLRNQTKCGTKPVFCGNICVSEIETFLGTLICPELESSYTDQLTEVTWISIVSPATWVLCNVDHFPPFFMTLYGIWNYAPNGLKFCGSTCISGFDTLFAALTSPALKNGFGDQFNKNERV